MIGVQTIGVLKKHGYRWPPVKPEVGQELEGLIIISCGRDKKCLHDSGYPFIFVFGWDKYNNLYDLGWHDHIWFRDMSSVNMDSLGSNIFRIWFNGSITVRSTRFVSTIEVSGGDVL